MTDIDNTAVSAQQQIAELQRQNELLRERLDRLESLTLGSTQDSANTSAPAHLHDPESTHTTSWSRRALLLGGVGAAAAAAAHVSSASPAAAAAGEPVLQGRINNAGNTITTLLGSAASTLVVANTNSRGQTSVIVTADGGDAVRGTSQTGNGVIGESIGQGTAGVRGVSSVWGVEGEGEAVGVKAYSPLGAAARLVPGELTSVPSGGEWGEGALVSTATGEVWLCTGSGEGPGDWRLLGSPASTGAYVPLNPARVYDSRAAQPDGNSILVGGTNRVINVGFARNPETGAVISRVVPLGTRAIAANITITGTTRSGFVALTPGDAPDYSGSSINWTAPQTTLANGLTLTTDTLVQLKAWTVGGNTHLIIDVVGYYAQA